MAFGRGRGNKRSSSTSCTSSSITMFVLVSVCVIAVWMLSSNSILPSRNFSRASTTHDGHHAKLPHHALIKSRPLSKLKITSSITTDDADDADDDDEKLTHLSEETTMSQPQEEHETQETQEAQERQETQEMQEIHETQETRESQEAQETQETQKIEQKQEVKEYEKEQKEQRYEDIAETHESGESKLGTQEQDHGTGKDSQEDVTFRDATKEEQNNIEHGFIKDVGQSGTSDNPKNEQKQEDDNNSANQENGRQEEGNIARDETRQQQEEEKNTASEEDRKEQSTTDDNETGNKEEHSTTEDNESVNKEEEITTNDNESENKEEQSITEDNETGNNEQQSTTEDNESGNKEEQSTTEDNDSGNKEEQSTTNDNESENKEQQNSRKEQQEEVQEENRQEGHGLGSGIPKESAESQKSWKSQATESNLEKQRQTAESNNAESMMGGKTWELCNATTGADYIPCLDNEEAIKRLRSRRHFEHRERHCPEDPPTCLVPLPQGYKESIKWPESRDKIWYHNVPHTLLAEVKGHQNWVKVTGEFLTFPGGGTQFIHGALHYIDFLQKSLKQIRWGKHTRVLLDVGCGVASFGGYLFERDVLAMSFAPKDEHVAQVQFALERKIPAISAVMGSKRLPYPSRVFDLIHCARCRVPWHNEGGLLLLELNRVLRPGGYFVWSATPVYQKLEEDVEIWRAMSSLTKSMCWELVTINKDRLNGVGAAIYRKPTTNECYEKRKENEPPMCQNDDDANAAWYVPLRACMHKVPTNLVERGSKWPVEWPRRLQTPPYWLNSSQMGIYGKPAPRDFTTDYEHWKQVVSKVYMNEIGISWSNVRNVMDMRAVYGGFAAALKDLQVWVMNVVNINSPDTLPIIFERGLFGIYHDWCESFSTYPRSYDLLHADHLFSKLKARCNLVPVMAEVDRIVRPGGKFIVRDESNVIREVENMLKSMHWDVHLTFSKNQEGLLSAQKGFWRPYIARIGQERLNEMK